MPQGIDYAALAEQARQGAAPPTVDYAALAEQARQSANLYDPARKPASTEDYYQPDAGPEGSSTGRFFSSLGEALNPVTLVKGIAGAVAHPIDTGKALLNAQLSQGHEAIAAGKSGRVAEAIGHGVASILPVLGPAAAAAGEQIASGDVAGGLGKGAGLVLPFAVGAVAPKSLRVPAAVKADASAADALALAERAGVPVDAATATGNRAVKALQHVSDRSLAGSLVADAAGKAQAKGLATLGEQLAAKAGPRAVSAGEAGSAAQTGVGDIVTGNRRLANDAYDRFRAIEADPAHLKPVTLASGEIVQMPMPTDIGPVQDAVRPIAEKLAAKKAVTGALIGNEATAAAKLDAILKSERYVPASVADSALSDLKSMARTNHPDLRNVGQGIAAKAVRELHGALETTVQAAGPYAAAALNEGRLATKAKYAAADVLKKLEGSARTKSPVTAFRGMTQAGDTGAGHLADVLTQAPATKPLVARAVLDGLIDHPTAGPAKTWSDWQKIGPETKALLYTPEHVKDLDAFFKLRKMMAENPNPSGTAHTLLTAAQGGLLLTEPVSGAAVQIASGALSSLLHSPRGVKLLTRGMRIPLGNKAAGAAWLADLATATSPSGSPSSVPMPATGASR